MNKQLIPKLLQLVDYDAPILRQPTQTVTFPLSQEDQQIIADMIYSIQPAQLKAANAPWEAAVGMAANQWGINKSIFLFCPTGDSVKDLTVIINPSYSPIIVPFEAVTESCDWEGCFSVPLATGNIKRNFKIQVKFQDQQGTKLEAELSDWPARVWQHENDHLNGYLYDDQRHGKCLEKKVFDSYEAVEAFYGSIREARK